VRSAGYSSAIHEVVDRLFVYGTLRTGQTARSLIADHVARAVPATTTGTLIAFPEYPGLVDAGSDTIVGELVWLRDLAAAFALLDAYEGEDFLRILKKVRLESGEDEWGWCYVLADPRLAEAGTTVPSGDWVRWLSESGR
jgi:gamma-glutamylcyclotransferase (GGCT)/AIG2-like uncharacterized protein YtfP